MQDLGLWQAVWMWCSGQKLEEFSMYGLPMLWWARTGKYLQFIGGLVAVLDLIGPDRMVDTAAKFGAARQTASVETKREIQTLRELINCLQKKPSARALSNAIELLGKEQYIRKTKRIWIVSPLVVALCVLIALPCALLLEVTVRHLGWPKDTPIIVVVSSISDAVSVIGLVGLVGLFSAFGLWLLVGPACGAVAWLLKIGRVAHIAKWVAVCFVAIGFHLDLLGS